MKKEFKVKIFTRSRTGATRTEAGNEIIQKSVEAMGKIDELMEKAYENTSDMKGELRIGTIPGTAMVLPRILSSYKSDFPNVQIQITEKSSQDIMDDVKRNHLDLGLIGLTEEGKEKEDAEIDLEIVLRGKMIVAASKQSSLAFANSISPEEIQKHALVIYNDDRMWEFVNDLSDRFGPLNILFSTNNMDAIRNAVHENLAITIGPDYTVKNDPFMIAGEGVQLEITNVENDYPGMALVSSTGRGNSTVVKKFVLKLRAYMEELRV